MLRSMTGYGRSELNLEDIKVVVEVKSVNHRYLETVVRLPRKYSLLEEKIKLCIKNYLARGRVEVWIGIEELSSKGIKVNVDKDLAMDYYYSLKELAESAGIQSEISIYELSKLEGVVTLEEEETDLDKMWTVIEKPLKSSLDQLAEMRKQEGIKLEQDIEKRNNLVRNISKEIESKCQNVIEAYRGKLLHKIENLVSNNNVELDSNRVENEVAIFADKCDITEEIVRLTSHCEQFMMTIKSQESVGRKLDFILQEMNREANTISSKSADAAISQKVVDVKSEIEKMREQVQNIE